MGIRFYFFHYCFNYFHFSLAVSLWMSLRRTAADPKPSMDTKAEQYVGIH